MKFNLKCKFHGAKFPLGISTPVVELICGSALITNISFVHIVSRINMEQINFIYYCRMEIIIQKIDINSLLTIFLQLLKIIRNLNIKIILILLGTLFFNMINFR